MCNLIELMGSIQNGGKLQYVYYHKSWLEKSSKKHWHDVKLKAPSYLCDLCLDPCRRFLDPGSLCLCHPSCWQRAARALSTPGRLLAVRHALLIPCWSSSLWFGSARRGLAVPRCGRGVQSDLCRRHAPGWSLTLKWRERGTEVQF